MNKYTVQVTRIEYASEVFEVEAGCREDAIDKAEEMAANTVFVGDSAEYESEILESIESNLEEGETMDSQIQDNIKKFISKYPTASDDMIQDYARA